MKLLRAAFLALLACVPAQAARLERGPYVEDVTAKTAVLRFRADLSSAAWLTFGAGYDCERFQTFFPPAKEMRMPLYGLMPDTTHCYRIYLPADESTGVYKAFEGTFRTFRGEDKPNLTFLAFGESGSGSEEQMELAAQMQNFPADFVLHTGDISDTGLDTDADDRYFVPYSTMLARSPFFVALGLKDYGRDAKKEAGKGFLKANYSPFHSVPLTGLPPYYYFFDAGNARFLVIDANALNGAQFAPPLDLGGRQYKWLDHFLSKAADRTWKFVVVNRPLYSSTARDLGPEMLEVLEPLLVKYGVDMVLQGYTHNYERTKPLNAGAVDEAQGVVYLTLGGGGLALDKKRTETEWSEKFIADYHFARFEIADKSLKMTVHDKDGKVIDELEIQK